MCCPSHLADVDAFDKAIVTRVFVQEIVNIIKRLPWFRLYYHSRSEHDSN